MIAALPVQAIDTGLRHEGPEQEVRDAPNSALHRSGRRGLVGDVLTSTGKQSREAMTRKHRCDTLATMATLEDIEKAVTELPADQLAKFRAWFDEFEAARFDQRIERDAAAGKLDQLAEAALADFRAGRARELWAAMPKEIRFSRSS
jgi:hypothetical protein